MTGAAGRTIRLIGLGALALGAPAGPFTKEAQVGAKVPPARDGNIAIGQELCAARKAATLDAYDLFIARHPQHPLAEVAKRERAELARKTER
ncbi:MAG TPA: hypothetical protein VF727_05360 [Allosphingosinicella sp.]|jgi:hypothetical protein